MTHTWDTFFVLGAPGAGKTTIGRATASRLNRTFRSIDDWTPRGEPMTDAQVHEALRHFLENVGPTNEVAEFSHHDYVQLLETNEYPMFTSARKVIVTAPLTVCIARNRQRRSPVRESYVERAWQSAEALARCSTQVRADAIVIDTSSLTVDAAVVAVTNFVTDGEGI